MAGPDAGPGQVLVEVRAAGLNFADILARVGLYPDAPKTPCVMGYEVAGVVEAVGPGVTGFEPGQRVIAATRFNGFAERASRRRDERAAAAGRHELRAGRGAAGQLRHRLRGGRLMAAVRQGETVLVHAAAGGVGIAALQMLRDAGRRGDRHRLGLEARRDPRAGRRARDRLPHPGREGGGQADHRRAGGGRRARRAR